MAVALAACSDNAATGNPNSQDNVNTTANTVANTTAGEVTTEPIVDNTEKETPAITTVDWEKAAKAPSNLTETPESAFTYSYSSDVNGIVITKYKGNSTNVIIPASIEDEPVTMIDSGAFANNNTIEYVYFPESVTTISNKAFSENPKLTLVIPENIIIPEGCIDFSIKNLAISDNALTMKPSEYLPFFQNLSNNNNILVENLKYKDSVYSFAEENRNKTIAELYNSVTGCDYNADIEITADWKMYMLITLTLALIFKELQSQNAKATKSRLLYHQKSKELL